MNASASSLSSSSLSSFSASASFRSTSSNDWDATRTGPSIADQPLPSMTVREYLERVGKDAERRIMDKANAQNAQLWKEFEQVKHMLLQDDGIQDGEGGCGLTLGKETDQPEEHTGKKSKVVDFRVVLEVTYDQDFHQVEVRVGQEREAKVGRSRGKQFLPGQGISLHFDQEVSTTHGRFFVHTKTGRVCFEDLGSTNKTSVSSGEGTRVLPKFEPVAIHVGDTLYMGASTLRVLEVKESSS
ncbi:hypothetical protein BASA81_008868 [Batrachochytrium salamandrivorans]|nr:hypothetical protein BASA81_008868 [Batrachochytrium salamandrivorans]